MAIAVKSGRRRPGRWPDTGGRADGGAVDDPQPTAFLVRYSPGWPITAPLDYVGPGSATSQGRCTAVAIGTDGKFAVGQQTGAAGDLDAVLMKF